MRKDAGKTAERARWWRHAAELLCIAVFCALVVWGCTELADFLNAKAQVVKKQMDEHGIEIKSRKVMKVYRF